MCLCSVGLRRVGVERVEQLRLPVRPRHGHPHPHGDAARQQRRHLLPGPAGAAQLPGGGRLQRGRQADRPGQAPPQAPPRHRLRTQGDRHHPARQVQPGIQQQHQCRERISKINLFVNFPLSPGPTLMLMCAASWAGRRTRPRRTSTTCGRT